MSNKQTAKTNYFTAAMTAVEPLINALNSNVGEGDQDTGHELPSQRDVGIRIVVGGICQVLHNQLFGQFETSSGSKIQNVFQRFMDSEERTGSREFLERVENGVLTRQDLSALDWYAKNEARFNWLTEMHNVYTEMYENITGEKWKPYERKETEKATNLDANKQALLERIKARVNKAA